MAEIEKVMGVSADDIEKIMGIDKGDIEKIMGVEIPASLKAYQGLTSFLISGDGDAAGNNETAEVYTLSMSSTGDVADAGDLTTSGNGGGFNGGSNVSNGNRIVYGGGYSGGSNWTGIDYFAVASWSGGSTDFGDLVASGSISGAGSCSNGTKAVAIGGYRGAYSSQIDEITIASTGDASNQGNNTTAGTTPCGSSTLSRGLISGGFAYYSAYYFRNDIAYISMTSVGDATDSGDLQDKSSDGGSANPSTEARIINRWGGWGRETTSGADDWSPIDYQNPASTVDSSDFGDLDVNRKKSYTGPGDNIRGHKYGGGASGGSFDSDSQETEYITIASTSNGTSMNDLPHNKKGGYSWTA